MNLGLGVGGGVAGVLVHVLLVLAVCPHHVDLDAGGARRGGRLDLDGGRGRGGLHPLLGGGGGGGGAGGLLLDVEPLDHDGRGGGHVAGGGGGLPVHQLVRITGPGTTGKKLKTYCKSGMCFEYMLCVL